MRFAALGVDSRNSSEKTRDAVNAFRVRKFRDTPHRGGWFGCEGRLYQTTKLARDVQHLLPSIKYAGGGSRKRPQQLRSVAGCNGEA